jgi:putative addiction module component (TIGR02574 family)
MGKEQNAVRILREALTLPPEARAAIAGSLLDSLDENVDESAEAAWKAEIHDRLQEIDRKKIDLVPWSEAKRRISGQ